MIEVKGLTKTFKVHKKEPGFMGSVKSLFFRKHLSKVAVNNVDLTINDGEIIGLIGANGAGKTTLTKILSGIIHPTSGTVSVLGHNPWHRKNEYRKQMSLIMGQKAQLWWDLPAMDGFLLLKEIYQIPENEFYESIEYLSECLMIKDQLKVQVRKLSLGERMKVELMAALIHKPKVVFLDEPTIGLDLMAQKAVREFIKSYRKEFNPIMILTSHYMEDIEELCERVVIIKDGSFIYDGSLENIKNNYAKNKLITATTFDENEIESFSTSFPKDLGSVSFSDLKLEISSPREKTMQAATYLMNNLSIKDLNIQEEQISDIIELIMRQGKVSEQQ
jgi:ABC-2 type transport system ATP-binding protein